MILLAEFLYFYNHVKAMEGRVSDSGRSIAAMSALKLIFKCLYPDSNLVTWTDNTAILPARHKDSGIW